MSVPANNTVVAADKATTTTTTTTTATNEPPASLSLFFLPQNLIPTLITETQTDSSDSALLEPTLATTTTTTTTATTAPTTSSTRDSNAVATSVDSTVPSCRVCGIPQFESVEKQREHVKLDWHRYNLKRQLLDKRASPISEQQFENILQDLSSISGSDQDDDDDSDDSDNAFDSDGDQGTKSRPPTKKKVAAAKHQQQGSAGGGNSDGQEALIRSLMKKLELTVQENQQARNQDPVLVHQQQVLEQQLQEARMSPMIWFTSTLYPETVRLGVYKNALPNKGQTEDLLPYLQSLQIAAGSTAKKNKNRRAKRDAALALEAEIQASSHSTQENTKETLQEEEDEDEEDDEDEKKVDTDQDWIKYQMQAKQKPDTSIQPSTNKARYWTLIMIGGGHFAGVVMDLAGQVTSHGRDMKVVAHKTFHRYTVRKKQGGSQAAHGVANSAGARIRMYNEEALKLEVRELLDSWSQWIQQSECVFVHSPGNNRRVLYYDNSVLSAAERQGRLRSIPFMTRRPTLSELKRAYQELSSVKISVLTRRALEQMEQAEQQALEKAIEASHARSSKEQDAAEKKVGKKENVIPEAPAEILKLVELIKKGRVEALSTHLTKLSLDPSQLLPISSSTDYDAKRTPTILHLASHHGQPAIVKLLLEKFHADPTTTTVLAMQQQQSESSEDTSASFSTNSMTAYDMAKDKETRNAFRRAMAVLPDAWDWVGLAHVPSALTAEMEAEQERKAKEKTKKLLDAERERKKTRDASRPTTPVQSSSSSSSPSASSPSSNTVGGQSIVGRNLASATAANSHLSPELRMRLERERRAAAAEARMAAMRQADTIRRAVQDGKSVCVACGKSLEGLTPFDKFGRKFCTTDCVAKGPA